MLFNTGYKASRCPQYENGDNIRYPTTDPVGGFKLYTEDYVQDIANAIREASGTERTFLISEMGDAIRPLLPGGLKATEFDLTISECTIS